MGVFEDEKVELIDGVVVEMSPAGTPHAILVARLLERLVLQLVGAPVSVIPQSSIEMTDYSMPEPDLAVLPRPRTLHTRLRGGLFVIEVAVTSLRKDLMKKSRIYAQADVPEYWVVDVDAEEVVVHTMPASGLYAHIERFPRSGILRPTQLPGVEILIDELFRDE
jgi:Uma2 family endonuclease